jgi:hypothetical protein
MKAFAENLKQKDPDRSGSFLENSSVAQSMPYVNTYCWQVQS